MSAATILQSELYTPTLPTDLTERRIVVLQETCVMLNKHIARLESQNKIIAEGFDVYQKRADEEIQKLKRELTLKDIEIARLKGE